MSMCNRCGSEGHDSQWHDEKYGALDKNYDGEALAAAYQASLIQVLPGSIQPAWAISNGDHIPSTPEDANLPISTTTQVFCYRCGQSEVVPVRIRNVDFKGAIVIVNFVPSTSVQHECKKEVQNEKDSGNYPYYAGPVVPASELLKPQDRSTLVKCTCDYDKSTGECSCSCNFCVNLNDHKPSYPIGQI